ncbi:Acetylxylan esterase 2 [Colletotrichum tanaceti]|uniref:Acetylxylan esterase 2 n=1 Tax=Colletotrichum tanaceti TaxID=1306861 RepID=A0A4U6X3M8_9PEZI|nr:Acetylxylan esterase 2 [Colletotrichum tanaceti]TKW49971.1 Acetylxylan esterase 2 [Colletotrichum tanaceti]
MVPSPTIALGFLGALQGVGNGDGKVLERRQKACATGVHMIVARASTERPGTGVIGRVASNIQAQIPGSEIEAVDYPAELNPYAPSQQAGVKAMTKLVKDYAAACPQSKMVLLGYSQGAHVTADILCGASGNGGSTATQPQGADVTDKIAAVVLMGDPSHVKGQAYNRGTSQNDGMFPRQNTAGCDAVAKKMVSYCNTGDPFCDKGRSLQVHLRYVQSDGDKATQFVVSQVKKGGAQALAG